MSPPSTVLATPPAGVAPPAPAPGAEVTEALERAGIDFVSGVADSGVKELVAALEARELDRGYVLATREDNAVALAAGAWLAGRQPLVFMESSGIGNAVDALTSLAIVYRIPMVLLIVWAGYRGRDVPHHNAIGEPLEGLLAALSIPVLTTRFALPFPAMAERLAEAVELARRERHPVAVLGIPPELEHE